jgi:MFS superfamily sulfate permease-like transporter
LEADRPGDVRVLARQGRGEVVVYAVTLSTVVATDLLKGVLLGLLVASGLLLVRLAHLRVDVGHDTGSARTAVHLRGSATFLCLPGSHRCPRCSSAQA